MTWFEDLTGLEERSPEFVRSHMAVDGDHLVSFANRRRMLFGEFTIPSLTNLKELNEGNTGRGPLRIQPVEAKVEALHQDPGNANSVFQVASQFNCLEMAFPNLTPDDGVGMYQNYRTQGTACAISAGAATIYRNYFVPHCGELGQSATKQIDCLADIGKSLGNQDNSLWAMRNGYCSSTLEGLETINRLVGELDSAGLEKLRGELRIGFQQSTEVTVGDSNHNVTQVFCSALPVGYSSVSAEYWATFAQLVLDGAYEATFFAAMSNFKVTGCNKLFLTLLCGGTFGNNFDWTLSAIKRSIRLFSKSGLDVAIVCQGRQSGYVNRMLSSLGPNGG